MKKQVYDHLKIENKWQKEWDKKKVYKTETVSKKKPYYVLDMFPYPSGQGLHVGHPRGYIGSDVFARFKRMQGYNVLHPMGFDAFGLPAEQYAITTGKHPSVITNQAIKRYKKQLEIIGFSYDWSREIETIDPEYYKWTQYIFLKIYNSFFDTKKQKARPVAELIKIFEKEGNAKVNEYTVHDTTVTFSKTEWKTFSPKEKQDILMNYRLAYEGYAEVNWCKDLGTVLANDEVIEKNGKLLSERGEYPVERKNMRQWFMRISAYGDRLLKGLDLVDFAESTKEVQKNWIGKSEGAEIEFSINDFDKKIKVFTTRADTLFGVTYVVLAPEHSLVNELVLKSENRKEIEKYIQTIKNKTQEERTESKEKTGIEIKGIKVVNPANGEEVPVWIADYVLASYGTGAVMAVPLHDERDFEFAKKYKLPIKNVVEPKFFSLDSPMRENLPIIKRNAVCLIIRNPKDDTYLCSVWKGIHMHGMITGGVEEGEDLIKTALREIYEETGYKNIKFLNNPGVAIHSFFYHRKKEENRWARFQYLNFELIDEEQDPIDEKESMIHDLVWKKRDQLENFFSVVEGEFALTLIDRKEHVYTGLGVLCNSGEFDGLDSDLAKKEITKFVGGRLVTKYKMRDAIFARQRYWGEPIPLMHDKKTGLIKEIPLTKLPLKLPKVQSYTPVGTGESPLASVKAWRDKGYETNTMPGWAGSSWYFLRYMDPKNKKAIAGESAINYWKNVDMYVGGTEHNTGHLLYARFWHKVLFDLKIAKTEEPFKALRHQGMIGGSDGRKMSKRWGNVINPDDVIETYGADTLRVFEMFLGPFNASLPWSTEGIIGSRRFIERVFRLQAKVVSKKEDKKIDAITHKTVKKVTEDILEFNFNTAISAMMICLNEYEAQESISQENFTLFLKILAPFAPHVTEELQQSFSKGKSIHLTSWPVWDDKKIVTEEFNVPIQINGKLRAIIMIRKDIEETELKEKVLAHPTLAPHLEGKEIKRFIYIKEKIVNIVL